MTAAPHPSAPHRPPVLHLDCPPQAFYVSHVRKAIACALTAWHTPAATIRDVELLAGELVNNAVTHAAAVTDVVHIAITLSRSDIRCEVTDGSPHEPRLCADPDSDNGRGLMMVNALARTWGYEPTDGTPGKRVWFVYCLG